MLEVLGLEAFYGESKVLHGIDIDVGKGERVAILGRNGAGKSTLLKSMVNAGPRVVGRISWDGVDLAKLSPGQRARLGLCLVPEDRRIFPNLSVLDNIRIGQTAAPRVSRTPSDVVKDFQLLQPLVGRMGNQLSGGQQQMLAVARGFASLPKIMLLDEPTEGLAPVIVSSLAQTVRSICERDGIGLVLCEQSISFARRVTDRVLVIDAGTVVFRGDWRQFDNDSTVKNKYLAV